MTPLPLNLCVFDTTKGHFGVTTIYQRTISSLATQIPLSLFANRYVHIKVNAQRSDEVATLGEMQTYYRAHGFEVHVSEGAFKHHDISHQAQYCLDAVKMFTKIAEQRVQYSLWLESDFEFYSRETELVDHFALGMRYLDAVNGVLCARFPRYVNEPYRLNKLREKHGMDVTASNETDPRFARFVRHNDNLSCNPFIARTRDLYAATRMLDLEFARFGHHIEHGFTHCLRWLSPDKLPYSIYDPSSVNVLHIGTRLGEEDREPPTWIS